MPITDQCRLDRAEVKIEKLQDDIAQVEQGLAVHETGCEGRHTALNLKLTQIDAQISKLAVQSDAQSEAMQRGFHMLAKIAGIGFLLVVALMLGGGNKLGPIIMKMIEFLM